MSRGDGGLPRQEPERTSPEIRPPRFAATLRRQFRDIMQRLTRRSPSPEPRPRRRRTGETGRGFRIAASRITRRVVRSILTPLAQSIPLPGWDLFTWLQQWAECDDATITGDFNQASDRPAAVQESSGLSLHP